MRRLIIAVFALSLVVFAQSQAPAGGGQRRQRPPATPEEKAKRPSPPGIATVTLNGKKITIDYSRPKVQDPQTGQKRKMLGDHDPYGKVWRAGANEATTFATEGNVNVGGTTVPAGNYTLFTLPESDKWTLIISKQTGEWGIPYPGEQLELARIPMKVGKSDQFNDQFTISFQNQHGKSADPVLTWEDWKVWVPVKAK